MKKRIAKISALVCIMALVLTVIFAMTACGESGTKYTYSDTNVEMTGDLGGEGGNDNLKTMYDAMYKNSSITVSESKIVWKISDVESTMTVKKDGDKYVLSGEYVDQMKTALSAGVGGISGAGLSVSFDMYGMETENGFDIVMKTSSTSSVAGSFSMSTVLTISFIK